MLWQYTVKSTKITEFLSHYNAEGTWAQFFNQDKSYLGTQLLRDTSQSDRFVTIDRWETKLRYRFFRDRNQDQYARIDQMCEELTESEEFLGEVESP